jgi:hypothetical protein
MKIFTCSGATHGVTSVADATHVEVMNEDQTIQDPGNAGDVGPVEEQRVGMLTRIRLFSQDPSELQDLVGIAAANLVVNFKKEAGAAATATYKNIQFNKRVAQTNFPYRDGATKVAPFYIEGLQLTTDTDTPATLEVFA